MKKKKTTPLARTLRWARRRPFLENYDVARFYLRAPYLDSRDIEGKVGETLLAMGDAGKATFLDKPPVDIRGHLMVLGYQHGVIVHYFKEYAVSWSWTVRMCARYRNKLVGGAGKMRWAKVKATA